MILDRDDVMAAAKLAMKERDTEASEQDRQIGRRAEEQGGRGGGKTNEIVDEGKEGGKSSTHHQHTTGFTRTDADDYVDDALSTTSSDTWGNASVRSA